MNKFFNLIAVSALLALTACGNSTKSEATIPVKKDIGLQLYSVRELIGNPELFAKNQEKVLAELATMGYTTVETANYNNGKIYGMNPADFKAALDKAGLEAISSHTTRGLSAEELASGDFSESLKWWDECIAAHKVAGMEYIVTPYAPVPATMKELQTWCAYHNAIGKKCAEAGIKYGYHNHSHEFNKVEGQEVMLDYMIANTDPANVFFQLDVYWAVRGGVSPVAYFKKYPGRFKLLHIKDHEIVGQSGMVGFDAIFKNTDAAGTEAIIVELEGVQGGALMDGIEQSINYLQNACFVKPSYKK